MYAEIIAVDRIVLDTFRKSVYQGQSCFNVAESVRLVQTELYIFKCFMSCRKEDTVFRQSFTSPFCTSRHFLHER